MNTVKLLQNSDVSELRSAMLDDNTPIEKNAAQPSAPDNDVNDPVANIANKKELQDILLECSPKKIDLMLRVCKQIKDTDM